MEGLLSLDPVTTISGISGALVTLAVWLRKLKPTLALDDKIAASAAADTGIIHRLEAESKRLSEQNIKLAEALNTLQLEVSKLMAENGKLHVEVAALRAENADMRAENKGLKVEIRELTSALNGALGKKPQ